MVFFLQRSLSGRSRLLGPPVPAPAPEAEKLGKPFHHGQARLGRKASAEILQAAFTVMFSSAERP